MFGFWRGSTKFRIYITASTFHNVRLALWLSDNADNATEYENSYYQIIDIQGDTETEFTIPYTPKYFANRADDGSSFGVWAKVLSWSQPDMALSCPIHLNVYKAAASDIEYAGQFDLGFNPDHNPRADFVKEFPGFHPSFTAYSCEGLNFGEKVESIRECLHRYHPYGVLGTSYVYDINPISGYFYGIEMWAFFYRFWRGSTRYKVLLRDSRYIECVRFSNNLNNFACTYLSSPTNPVVEFECPYYFRDAFQHTSASSNNYINCSTCTEKYYMKAAGDDFSFHFLRPFPSGVFTGPTVATGGLRGLMTWCTAGTPINVHQV